MEENKIDEPDWNTPRGIGSLLVVFVSGVIIINSLFFAYHIFELRSYFPFFFLADCLISLLAIVFAFHKIRVEKKYLAEIGKSAMKECEKKCLESQKTCIHEEELQRSNEELKKINQDYQTTTKKLFEREMELTKANKRLQELDQVKSEFVSVAAHQLRTPLTGIKWSYTALLDKATGPLNEDQKNIVEQGLENINYSIDLINDLLNTARLEEGKTELNLVEQAITPIIREVLSQHEPVIKEKKIEIDADLPSESSPPLLLDKEKIFIVFDNILANAVKYTPKGGKITLRHMRRDSQIQFKIKDTGIGIPEYDLPKVFSKFFRSKNAVSFQTSGSGLGLYVAKNIVEKHGGTIELESAEKEGTTVIFTLPIKSKK